MYPCLSRPGSEKASSAPSETYFIYSTSLIPLLYPLAASLKAAIQSCEGLLDCSKSSAEVLDDLKKEVRNRRRDVQHYLNLGHGGVCLLSCRYNMRIDVLVSIWRKFYLFLLQTQQLVTSSHFPLLSLGMPSWPLLLSSALSVFPNRLRPPCTTMPWTIWPALVVLWGVCWMFFEEYRVDNAFWSGFTSGSNEGLGFENTDLIGLFQGLSLPVPFRNQALITHPDNDINSGQLTFNSLIWDEEVIEPFDYQSQRQIGGPESSIGDTMLQSTGLVSLLVSPAVRPQDTLIQRATGLGADALVIDSLHLPGVQATVGQKEGADSESMTFGARSSSSVPVQASQSRDRKEKSARSSKHSQTEKYFCPHGDCVRSKPGSGFKRKDHLDQHLNGPHKHKSAGKAQDVSVTPLGLDDQVSDTETLLPMKKRKRDTEAVQGEYDIEHLSSKLAEERLLRRRAEEENERLRQRIENYEERMQKYEDRIDRMMSLFEDQKGKGK